MSANESRGMTVDEVRRIAVDLPAVEQRGYSDRLVVLRVGDGSAVMGGGPRGV